MSKGRENVEIHIKAAAEKWDRPETIVLDIAPNEHGGAKQFFKEATVYTLDVNEKYKPDFVLDLSLPHDADELLKVIGEQPFNCIICTEVLEHIMDPFKAANNLMFMLAEEGELYVTTPFNLRIHNPLPDYWRFTEHALREVVFSEWDTQIEPMETPDRELMPIAYRTIVRHEA